MEEILLDPIERKEFFLAKLGGQEVTPPDPVTRIERYLQDIIDGNASTLPPVTRVEFYLANISGADVPIPVPVTRIELYLAKIAGTDIGTPAPITRLEHWLQLWSEAGPGGVVETVSGTLPLTIANAISHAIHALTRYGLCTQDGVPTPDAPVDIMCNNGALTASKNIFDGGYTLGGTITNSGADGSTNAARLRLDYTLLPPGTYTLSTNGICNNTVVWAYSSATGSGATKLSPDSAFALLPFTFTLSEAKYVRAMCRNSNNPTLTAENAGAFQIEAGESATAYMAPGLVYASGTPEVLTVSGKNIFGVALTAGKSIDANGVIVGQSGRCCTKDGIPVKASTIYVLSYGGGARNGIFFYTADDAFLSFLSWGSTGERSFTTPANTGLVRFSFDKATFPTNLQLELGSTATAYEPYVTPQTVTNIPTLLSVGGYKDEAELISGIKTGKVGVSVYCGSADESWSRLGTNAFAVTNSVKKFGKHTMLCSHYTYTDATSAKCSSGEFGCSSGTPRTIYFKNELYDTVEDWRASLAADPIIVIYPLATPATEQTTAQHLSTHQGTNIVDSVANVGPVEAEVEYMARGA